MSASTDDVMGALAHAWRSGAPSYQGNLNPAGAQAFASDVSRRAPSAFPSCGGITCTSGTGYTAGENAVF